MVSTRNKRILRALSLAGILVVLGFLIPQSIGLGAEGFKFQPTGIAKEDLPLTQYNFYISGGIFLIGVLLFFFVELLISKDDSKLGDSIGFVSQGENPSLPFFKRFSLLQLFMLSFIIFGIFGIVSVSLKQQTFTGVAVLEQQFTPTASIIYSSLLIPIAENLGLALVIAFSFFSLRYFGRRTNMSNATFKILSYFIIPLIAGLYGLANHFLRYGGSDLSLLTVFVFWFVGGLITIAVGSFIPFWIMHLTNNAFFDIKRLFSSDVVIAISISLIIFLGILYFFLFMRGGKKDEF